MKPKKFNGKKKKTAATIQKDLGSNSGDETTITAIGIKGYPLQRMQRSKSSYKSYSRKGSRPSTSPCGSPIVLVRKKDGS